MQSSQPNNQQGNQHNLEKAIVAALIGSGVGLFTFANSPSQWLGCAVAWGTGEIVRYRRRWTYGEVVQGTLNCAQGYLGEVNETISPATDAMERKRVQIVSSCLRQLPMGEKIAESYIASQGLKSDWIKEFEVGSSAVCGRSKDGKTHLMLWRVQRFLQQHPDGILHICDPDYGSAHEGAEPNTWFGLPLDRVIHTNTEKILATIETVAEEVDTRAKIAQKIAAGELDASDRPSTPILLVCDEWSSFWGDLEKQQQERVLKQLNKITNRGIKQANVSFLLGLHDTSVQSNGLPQALLQRLGVILLYNAAKVEGNYRNLGLTTDPGEILHKLTHLPKVVGNLRPCVVANAGSVNLRAIPHLEVSDIEVTDYEPPDPDKQWWESFWTAEVEQKVIARMMARIQEGKGAIAWHDLADVAGFPQKIRVSSNRRYQLLKLKFDDLADTYSQAQTPPVSGNREHPDSPLESGNTEDLQGLQPLADCA